MLMTVQSTLRKAADIVLNHRAKEYGQSSRTLMHIRIASVWSGILDVTVTPQQVALCMAGMKLVRAASVPGHEDSYVDAVGYIGIASEIIGEPTTTKEAIPSHEGEDNAN